MNIQKLVSLVLVGTGILTACSTDDEPGTPEVSETTYNGGILVLNEGNFGVGNSTISYVDNEKSEITPQIFRKENEGKLLGDTGQNIGFYKDYAFIVMNVSNTIEVVDRANFKHIASIDTDLNNPRFIAFSEGKAFVTNWGDGTDPNDDFISVFNADTFTSLNKISVPEGPERIVAGSGRVFAAHKGGFNVNDKISVIDPVKSEFILTLTTGDHPNSLLIEGDHLWVLSGGKPSYSDNESAGTLSQIDLGTLEIVREFTFPNTTDHPANLDIENDRLYYTLGPKMYSFGKSETSLPATPVFELEGIEILYGFEVEGSQIFAASANYDFSGDGKLFIYDLTGNLLNTFSTGVNPNGIYFND